MTTISNDPQIQMPGIQQAPNVFSKASHARLQETRVIGQVSRPITGEQYRDVLLTAITGDSPLQARAPFDPEHDDDEKALVESIARDGQRVPVLLVEATGGEHSLPTFTILDGHRRVMALRYLQCESVRTIIVRRESLECDLITLTANVRKHLSPLEQARVIARLRERHNLTVEEIAKRVGLSIRYVLDLRSLLATDPAIVAALEKGDIKAKTALVLGQAPLEQQPQLAEIAAQHKVSEADAKRWVARITDTGETPEQAALALGITAEPKTIASIASVEAAPAPSAGANPKADPGPDSPRTKPEVALTIAYAQALLTDAFPEMDHQIATALAESAVKRSLNAQALKVAGLLASAGSDVEQAVDAGLSIINKQSARKIIHILDSVVDLRNLTRHGRSVPDCAPMLAALAKQMMTLRQAVVSSNRTRKKTTTKRS